ncbi:hypothetical protein OTU49_004106 [Cherax quadricarinatus]|uniref:Membrane protein BRI3 n=1 Tax=Cherax quadricarinatus TaxID=27406 RepID=A0AAW0XEM4_CHEQU
MENLGCISEPAHLDHSHDAPTTTPHSPTTAFPTPSTATPAPATSPTITAPATSPTITAPTPSPTSSPTRAAASPTTTLSTIAPPPESSSSLRVMKETDCPGCRVGVLKKAVTGRGSLLGVLCFPCTLLCCPNRVRRRCNNCRALF